jgi:uncharacterized protein DUF3306|tara:strand:- start:1244 stop:1705 length:462 start_codon:yes stop_codon:yes gene_type:complete
MKEKSASENFLSRWSRRKQQTNIAEETATEQSALTEQDLTDEPAPAKEPSDLPVWQRENVDPETKKQALRDLFRKPGFNQTDGLEEYENDYNYHAFAGLGSVVTHEMKRMLERQLAEGEATEHPATANPAEDAEQNNDTKPRTNRDEEDNPIA